MDQFPFYQILIKSLKVLCKMGFVNSLKNRTYLLFLIWFQKKHSTTHALIHLTELIRK